jgi:hypothetical protein
MSKQLIVPKNYKSMLDLNQTEKAIKLVKDTFQQQLSSVRNIKYPFPLWIWITLLLRW